VKWGRLRLSWISSTFGKRGRARFTVSLQTRAVKGKATPFLDRARHGEGGRVVLGERGSGEATKNNNSEGSLSLLYPIVQIVGVPRIAILGGSNEASDFSSPEGNSSIQFGIGATSLISVIKIIAMWPIKPTRLAEQLPGRHHTHFLGVR